MDMVLLKFVTFYPNANKNTCEVKIRDSGEIVKTGGDTEDFLSLDGIQFITYK